MTPDKLSARGTFAADLCQAAGEVARRYFSDRSNLVVDQKGTQDWVSEADRNVELFIRQRISEDWPDDGIVGEEHAPRPSRSGFTWVIDPIDGTTNFVNGIPAWTIVLAGVSSGRSEIGVIHDPNAGETFSALRGEGARLNGTAIQIADGIPLESGTVAVGYSNRVDARNVLPVVSALVERGAMFHRNASGALSIAYVAAGRLLGYVEEHMNAWDCLAGQLIVEEAGGRIEVQDADEMIRVGGRVIVGSPEVFDDLVAMVDGVWDG
ncbi:inositol monophosphatase family protein [Tropicimonas marinistellae]|uniref:inositol monophosphatase family protein n=1 Tax=Tropicimonas marinistellae TaxID=1739787 RepID=UPI0008336D2E|nr:inositol monophosphatase family protein [Tropicimonas marinistellae]